MKAIVQKSKIELYDESRTVYEVTEEAMNSGGKVSGWLEGPNKVYIPFLACGDLTGYDSDRSYPLPKVDGGTYQSLDPVQPPIAPPYKRALELKKASSQGFRELENPSLDS
ncbi:tRNA (cytidine(32)/guanosine(34)-2'-O)-methyltransferase [Trifolium repens]|nr:tRNA (cytidine(32)/guanosine(34)-2'-O)-methyltransferase [Trifolium repens]